MPVATSGLITEVWRPKELIEFHSPCRKRIDFEEVALERLSTAKIIGDLAREEEELTHSIIDLSNDLRAATLARDRDANENDIRSSSMGRNRIEEIKNRQLNKGAHAHGNESKPNPGVWTFGSPKDAFETYEFDTFSNRSIFEAKSFDDLRDLSSINVVSGRFGGQVLLSRDALNQLAERKSNAVEELRRSVAGQWGVKHGNSTVQRLKRQRVQGSEEPLVSDDSAQMASFSRESLGRFFAQQLVTTHQVIQEQDEHERLKPPSPQ